MIELFGISTLEAEARILREFSAMDLLADDTEAYLGHEDEDYWAKSTYFGVGVYWWMVDDSTELEPQPLAHAHGDGGYDVGFTSSPIPTAFKRTMGL